MDPPALGVRDSLDGAIRAHPPESGDYLVGWVVVAEWLHSDGHRSLAMNFNEESTPWQRVGYLDDALTGEGWE